MKREGRPGRELNYVEVSHVNSEDNFPSCFYLLFFITVYMMKPSVNFHPIFLHLDVNITSSIKIRAIYVFIYFLLPKQHEQKKEKASRIDIKY